MALVSTPLARQVIGCAIDVHRALGPGLFESVYSSCFAHRLSREDLQYATEVSLSVVYDGLELPNAYRADFIVEESLLIEVKSIEMIAPIHQAQVLTYLRLSSATQALLINFNVPRLVDGIRSFLKPAPEPVS